MNITKSKGDCIKNRSKIISSIFLLTMVSSNLYSANVTDPISNEIIKEINLEKKKVPINIEPEPEPELETDVISDGYIFALKLLAIMGLLSFLWFYWNNLPLWKKGIVGILALTLGIEMIF